MHNPNVSSLQSLVFLVDVLHSLLSSAFIRGNGYITFNNCIPSSLPRGAAAQSRPHSLMHILFILRGQKLTNIFIPSSAAYDSINSGTKYHALVFSSFTAIQAAHPESELIFPFRAFYTFPVCVYMKDDLLFHSLHIQVFSLFI